MASDFRRTWWIDHQRGGRVIISFLSFTLPSRRLVSKENANWRRWKCLRSEESTFTLSFINYGIQSRGRAFHWLGLHCKERKGVHHHNQLFKSSPIIYATSIRSFQSSSSRGKEEGSGTTHIWWCLPSIRLSEPISFRFKCLCLGSLPQKHAMLKRRSVSLCKRFAFSWFIEQVPCGTCFMEGNSLFHISFLTDWIQVERGIFDQPDREIVYIPSG